MSDRIKCSKCGAESFNDSKTILCCGRCYKQLEEEVIKIRKMHGVNEAFKQLEDERIEIGKYVAEIQKLLVKKALEEK